jgi:hypothetical protein
MLIAILKRSIIQINTDDEGKEKQTVSNMWLYRP